MHPNGISGPKSRGIGSWPPDVLDEDHLQMDVVNCYWIVAIGACMLNDVESAFYCGFCVANGSAGQYLVGLF